MNREAPTLPSLWQRAKEVGPMKVFKFIASVAKVDSGHTQGTKVVVGKEKLDRRTQVQNAQRKHRRDKKNYIKQLEEDISRMRRAVTDAETGRNRLVEDNDVIKLVLSQAGIDFANAAGPAGQSFRSLEDSAPMTVSIGYDEHVQADCLHLRNFSTIELNYSDVAVNFVLALEHCCCMHIPFYPFEPNPSVPETNHALLASSYYLALAPPCHFKSDHTGILHHTLWESPGLALEKLHGLSKSLDVQNFEVTPVQAWFRIAEDPRWNIEDIIKDGAIEKLKKRLGGLVTCQGFGAVIEIEDFEAAIEDILVPLS